MHGFHEFELACRFAVARTEQARIEVGHRDAFAVVDVVVRFARGRQRGEVAQLLEELLRVLAARAREAPGEVLPPPDEHVGRDRGDDALRIHPATVQVGLHHDLRVEVAELRSHHGQRVPVRGVAGPASRKFEALRLDAAAALAACAAVALIDPGSITAAPGVAPVGTPS